MCNEEELLAQAANLTPIYVDGFTCYRVVNGVMRCVGFLIDGGAQLNLIISIAGADAANRENRHALDRGEPTKCITIWSGGALAH